MAVTYTKINGFVAGLANGDMNLGSHQLAIALTNTANTSTWTQYSQLTPVSTTNLSGSNPLYLTTTSSAQVSGVYKLVISNLTLTATGTVGPFQYIYIYDNTATNKDLMGYFDNGTAVTLNNADTFILQFDATNGLLQLT